MGATASAYLTAAETLRVAYWDWASDATLPEVVTLDTLAITSPTGPLTIKNPFRNYYFQNYPFSIQYMNAGVLSTMDHTVRCPDADGNDNVAAVNAGLQTSGFKNQVVRTYSSLCRRSMLWGSKRLTAMTV